MIVSVSFRASLVKNSKLAPGEVTEFRPWRVFTDIGAEIKRLALNTSSRKKRARVGHKMPIGETDEGLVDGIA